MDTELCDEDTKELIEKMQDLNPGPDGWKKGTRPVHSLGLGVHGVFKASKVARQYCTAKHFEGGEIGVSVRFSNGSGSGTRRDGWSDIRGMATRFYLTEDKKISTDLVSMTLGVFPNRTLDQFKELVRTTLQMLPVRRESPWRKLWDYLQMKDPLPYPYPGQTTSHAAGALAYANQHREAQLAVLSTKNIGAPVSYARASYHAVHTFIVFGSDGQRRHVRFSWLPVYGVKKTKVDPHNPKPPKLDYLNGEMRKRLNSETRPPTRFVLQMTIAESGDAVNDPTKPWPRHRVKVIMGTLTLKYVYEDQQKMSEQIAFNPCHIVPGHFEVSSDEILLARKEIYECSSKMRNGTGCPFHASANADG